MFQIEKCPLYKYVAGQRLLFGASKVKSCTCGYHRSKVVSLYRSMYRLSSCIFEWNRDDVFKLKDAKIKQLYGVDYFNVDDKLRIYGIALLEEIPWC